MIERVQLRVLCLLLLLGCVAGGVYAGSELKQTDTASASEGIDAGEISRILALSDDIDYGEYLAGECASCHLTQVVEGSAVPVIHGSKPAHLVQALLEYRSGIRTNTTMALVANGLGDEEVAAIAHYLAASGE